VFTKEIEAAGFRVTGRPAFLKDNYFVHFVKLPGDDRPPGPRE
jgi:hypothetical protein